MSVGVCISESASAWTGHVTWTTWLRAGPGLQYTVTDEIDTDAAVEVLGCEGGWCRTQVGNSVGYIQAGMIAKAAPDRIPAQNVEPCFDARRSGYKDGEVYRYCPK